MATHTHTHIQTHTIYPSSPQHNAHCIVGLYCWPFRFHSFGFLLSHCFYGHAVASAIRFLLNACTLRTCNASHIDDGMEAFWGKRKRHAAHNTNPAEWCEKWPAEHTFRQHIFGCYRNAFPQPLVSRLSHSSHTDRVRWRLLHILHFCIINVCAPEITTRSVASTQHPCTRPK